eukprot:PRCOL_00004827-RA
MVPRSKAARAGKTEATAPGPEVASQRETCACLANELGFAINCSNTAPVMAALGYLDANCSEYDQANVSEDEDGMCSTNYVILQSHHDFCSHHDLPIEAETRFHIYEDSFEGCEIGRQFDPELEVCPPVADCADLDKQLADIAILDSACVDDCSSDACKAAFQAVLMAHDTCHKDLLHITLEVALHDFELVCDDWLCNSVTEPFSLFCEN